MFLDKLKSYFANFFSKGKNQDQLLEMLSSNEFEQDKGVTEFINKNKNSIDENVMTASNKLYRINEFNYLDALIRNRLKQHFPDANVGPCEPDEFPVASWNLFILPFIKATEKELQRPIEKEEILLLLIALVPHLQPDLFDNAFAPFNFNNADFPPLGGVRGKNCRFFLPTGETALFLIAGDNFGKRMKIHQYFGAEHFFWEKKILWLEDMQSGEPAMHGRIIMPQDYIDLVSSGSSNAPQFSINFPAKKISNLNLKAKKPINEVAISGYESELPLDNLVACNELKEQIDEMSSWLQFNGKLMNDLDMKGVLRQGYRALFYGPPGTGKTFTAQLLGEQLGKDVYKIDLSMVVSKYIGETEKNLELLFARAENKNWILFFDEADALFGKRTSVRDAHDKYANQEVSYLLQRIEDFNGLVILATNMKNNIDDAFLRRFNNVVKFPFPDAEARKKIWQKKLPSLDITNWAEGPPSPDHYTLDNNQHKQFDIPEAIKKYELAGGSIINVVQFACIKGLKEWAKYNNPELEYANTIGEYINGSEEITSQPKVIIYYTHILEGIKKEMIKEGKAFV